MINSKSLVLLACFPVLGSAATCTAQENRENAPVENADKIIFEGSFLAGAETRYQQQVGDNYSNHVSMWSKGSLLFSAIGFLASVILANFKKKTISAFLYVLGAIGLIASLRSDDSRASARYIDHAVLAKRWESLHSEWDVLNVRRSSMDSGTA